MPVPVDVRHIADLIERTRTVGNSVDVQVLFGLVPVNQLVGQAFGQGLGGEASLLDLVGREVLEFLVGFHRVSDPDGVGTVFGVPFFLIPVNGHIQIIGVPPTGEVLLADLVDPVGGEALGDDEEAGEAASSFGDADAGEVQFQAEEAAVEELLGGEQ